MAGVKKPAVKTAEKPPKKRAKTRMSVKDQFWGIGFYSALSWVLTSPRIGKELREIIHGEAMHRKEVLEQHGVRFTDTPRAPLTKVSA